MYIISVAVVKVVGFKSLALTAVGSNPLWILSCEEAIQLAYETFVVLLRCPFVPKIMHGRGPGVFFHK
jgi:hypothetical protein